MPLFVLSSTEIVFPLNPSSMHSRNGAELGKIVDNNGHYVLPQTQRFKLKILKNWQTDNQRDRQVAVESSKKSYLNKNRDELVRATLGQILKFLKTHPAPQNLGWCGRHCEEILLIA